MIEVRICKNVGERSSTSWFYWVRVYHMCRIGMHTIIGLFRRTFPIHYTLNRYLTKISLYQNVCFTQYEENVTFSFLGSTFIVNPPIRVPRIETLTRLLAADICKVHLHWDFRISLGPCGELVDRLRPSPLFGGCIWTHLPSRTQCPPQSHEP